MSAENDRAGLSEARPWTPGPWIVGQDDLYIFAECGPHIADVTDVGGLPCVEPHEDEAVRAECAANARLIAAAPDLFEALEEMIGAWEYMRDRKPGKPRVGVLNRFEKALTAGRVALQAARGSGEG